jgi:hypothetical protein
VTGNGYDCGAAFHTITTCSRRCEYRPLLVDLGAGMFRRASVTSFE